MRKEKILVLVRDKILAGVVEGILSIDNNQRLVLKQSNNSNILLKIDIESIDTILTMEGNILDNKSEINKFLKNYNTLCG